MGKNNNWEYGILADAVEKGSSNLSINKLLDDNGSFPLFGAKGMVKGISFYQQENEYLAIIKDGAGVGRVSKHPANSSIVGTLQYILPKKAYKIEFIYYFLLSIDFSKYFTGSTIPHIYFKDYKNEPFPLIPLQEQTQIVKILDKAFAAIEKAKANIQKNIDNANELFQSELDRVFSQKGEGWVEKKLGELGKVSMCKRIFKDQTTSKGKIPFYKIGTFGKTPNAFISENIYKEFKSKYSFPKKGDVLISASGTIGRRVIYDGKPAYFQDSNIVWIDNDEKCVLNDYLYYFYAVCDWQPSKGATIKRLYNDNLRRIKISYPSIEIQRNSVKKFERLFNLTKDLDEKYRNKYEKLDELKKSILQKAFKGELTNKDIEIEDISIAAEEVGEYKSEK